MKLILLVVAALGCFLPSDAINGGTVTKVGDFKYIVGIKIVKKGRFWGSSTYFCTGAIIGEKHILTAAHCVTDEIKKKGAGSPVAEFKKHEVTVYANTIGMEDAHLREHQVVKRKVVNAYFVPKFFTTFIPDIAVLELSEKLNLKRNHLEIINLPESHDKYVIYPTKTDVSLAGYGEDVKGKTNYILKHMRAKVLAIEKCHNVVSGLDDIQFVCAEGSHVPLSRCVGDSGSPLVHEFKINTKMHREVIGVTSFGKGQTCHVDRMDPKVFVKVAFYRDFIKAAESGSNDQKIVVKHSY